MSLPRLFPVLLLAAVLLCSCESQPEPAPPTPAPVAATPPAPTQPAPPPPAPPLTETFDGEPQLSLFPRTGAFRPEDSDREGLGYWKAFIDHILRTSGPGTDNRPQGGRAWGIKGIKSLDSIAFFSPLAVKPDSGYRISFEFKGELPQDASAGVGVLEFDEFLWIGEQYSRSLADKHQIGSHEGVRLSGKNEWQKHTFTFTTSPRTAMIHLVLFRDGQMDREKPVWFDNIAIEPVAEASSAKP